MPDTIQTVFTVTALLGLVSLLLPLAERVSIPYAVLLALVGVAIGGASNIPSVYQSGGIPSPLERSGKDLRWDLDGDNGSKEEHRQWARDPSLPH